MLLGFKMCIKLSAGVMRKQELLHGIWDLQLVAKSHSPR